MISKTSRAISVYRQKTGLLSFEISVFYDLTDYILVLANTLKFSVDKALADEYFGNAAYSEYLPAGVEPYPPSIPTRYNGKIGVFEGAGYTLKASIDQKSRSGCSISAVTYLSAKRPFRV
jgi:hypothetical protein